MQAIILAAGMGKRLGTLTKENTKCMVRVNGIALIDRLLTQLTAIGLRRVVIVTGYQGEKLRNFIGSRYDEAFPIEYVDNPDYAHTNNIYSLYLAREKMAEDETLLIESDLIFEDGIIQMAATSREPAVALVAKYEPWMDGTMVRMDAEGHVTGFVTKRDFHYEEAHTYFKTVNVYKFSAKFSRERYIPFLEAYRQALGSNEYYEQVLRVIAFLDSTELRALPVGERKWYEIDDIQDLDIAEVIFSDKNDKLARYTKRYGGYWRFPYLLDFCYLVNPYFPPQRMKDELRAAADTLLTEYPSGMRVCTLLAAKCFGIDPKYIVPAAGAAELIRIIMEEQTGRVGMAWPTFEEYPNRLKEEQRVVFTPTKPGFRYTADDLMEYFGEHQVEMLVVINPDNPSGNYLPREDVLRLADWCNERGICLLLDESFADFSQRGVDDTLIEEQTLARHPNLIVMKSISKSYGVPGLRLGVLASADEALLNRVKRALPIWGINSFAEYYMQIYNKYDADYRRSHDKFVATREQFSKALEQVPYLKVFPSEANYFLCEVLPPYISRTLTEKLLVEHDILIKDCSTKKAFNGNSFIRIAVRDEADNQRLLECLMKG